ncbi:Succinate dehydrogenase cytochrome b subunit [Methylacidimicrobium sp. AP8]|uniref:succinate dehydrogenase cytochrome b subunit n=1 Tax=Methylacidimicrobium sp. AP8 TaxID=2730359 RepID=UPI0018C08F75|nr:succinate dehydrogenase cytochrome b subunit [Methylacidimicrobium sp. AP8]CAB4242655.1 Succinate dehydrogenase cytochrome b subunit [Methylacidimicrobium sp. AP8]
MTEQRTGVSTIGLKILMGVTGLILVGYVCLHMLGNWEVFLPPVYINQYAYLLKSFPLLLWTVRLLLLASFLIHVACAARLAELRRAARPVAYDRRKPNGASWESRTMLLTGVGLGLFVLFHLYHFTWHLPPFSAFEGFTTHLSDSRRAVPDVHRMMVEGLRNPLVAAIYLLGMGCLFFHVRHGVDGIFCSLGLVNRRRFPWQRWLSHALGWILFLGFSAIPVAILAGWVR